MNSENFKAVAKLHLNLKARFLSVFVLIPLYYHPLSIISHWHSTQSQESKSEKNLSLQVAETPSGSELKVTLFLGGDCIVTFMGIPSSPVQLWLGLVVLTDIVTTDHWLPSISSQESVSVCSLFPENRKRTIINVGRTQLDIECQYFEMKMTLDFYSVNKDCITT